MDEIDDRRGSGRVYILTTVDIELNGKALQATALDLSVSGISIWAPEGEDSSSPIQIKMQIDDQGPITVTGKVARQFESDGGAVWGIAFQDLADGIEQRLEAYLATLG